MTTKLTAMDVLRRYQDEELPEFAECELLDVNQIGNFGDQPIHAACIRGRVEEVLALVEGGADVNALGEMHYTPLQCAIDGGNVEILKLLLECGSTQTPINDFGSTAIDIALSEGREDIVKLLREWK